MHAVHGIKTVTVNRSFGTERREGGTEMVPKLLLLETLSKSFKAAVYSQLIIALRNFIIFLLSFIQPFFHCTSLFVGYQTTFNESRKMKFIGFKIFVDAVAM